MRLNLGAVLPSAIPDRAIAVRSPLLVMRSAPLRKNAFESCIRLIRPQRLYRGAVQLDPYDRPNSRPHGPERSAAAPQAAISSLIPVQPSTQGLGTSRGQRDDVEAGGP